MSSIESTQCSIEINHVVLGSIEYVVLSSISYYLQVVLGSIV